MVSSSDGEYHKNGRDTMQVEAPVEFTVTLFHEQRERLSADEWTDWHPMDLNDAQKGLSVGQRFQRRVNGRCTGIMIYDDTPGVRFEIDHEAVAPDGLEAVVSR